MSKILDEAIERATIGETLNPTGTKLLLGWLADPANDKSLDRPHVQAAVDRHYAQRPGGGIPAAALDAFGVLVSGKPSTTHSAVSASVERMLAATLPQPKGTA